MWKHLITTNHNCTLVSATANLELVLDMFLKSYELRETDRKYWCAPETGAADVVIVSTMCYRSIKTKENRSPEL